MVTIEELISQSPNPFDEKDFVAGSFLSSSQKEEQMVTSIHQEQLELLKLHLDKVNQSSNSRTVILLGDSGSGKTYFLGRMKRECATKGLFVYIDPWVDSRYFWRHILRRIVNILEQGSDSFPLLMLLKKLPKLSHLNLAKWSLDGRGQFINYCRMNYPNNFFNAREFFGALYDLLNPELYFLVCDWLRGDELFEDDLQVIRVKSSVDDESKAKYIISSLAYMTTAIKPMVLCFDQLDNIPRTVNGFLDLQPLFNFNSSIYTQNLTNLLVIISMPSSTWDENKKYIQPADVANGRIHETVKLKPINMQQVKDLWSLKLSTIHQQANPRPRSSIYPLSEEQLNIRFPGGKALPRTALVVGRELFEQYCKGIKPPSPQPSLLELFRATWEKEFNKFKVKVTHTKSIDTPQIVKMMQEALLALKIDRNQSKLLTDKFNSYSLSLIFKRQRILLIITEDQDMRSFYHLMKSCEQTLEHNKCDRIYLIRNSNLGSPNLKGYQIYQKIFHRGNNYYRHLLLSLTSIHYLGTYYELVKLATSQELLIRKQIITVEELKELTFSAKVLTKCPLLQELGLVEYNPETAQDV